MVWLRGRGWPVLARSAFLTATSRPERREPRARRRALPIEIRVHSRSCARAAVETTVAAPLGLPGYLVGNGQGGGAPYPR